MWAPDAFQIPDPAIQDVDNIFKLLSDNKE